MLNQKTRLFPLVVVTFCLLFAVPANSSAQQQVSVEPIAATISEPEGRGHPEEDIIASSGLAAGVAGPEAITVSTYAFSFLSSVSLEDMSSGTTQLVAAGSDDGSSPLTNIGFDFWYDGVRHTQFSANANGFIRLSALPAGSTWINNLNSATQSPVIASFWDDLCVGTNGRVHFKTIGSSPNRKTVIEWQNMQITRGSACSGVGGGTFQLWLFESAAAGSSPGVIQSVYGNGMVATAPVDGGYSVGLQSGVATNFASVTIATDTVSYDTANNTQMDAITAGKSYIFTPLNVPAAPTGLTFSSVTASSIQLNWTDNATNEVGYAIFRSTDGTNYTFVSQTAADAVSFNDTGLAPGTTYFYQVYAAAEGVISAALSGNQATAPAGEDSCAGAGGDWSDTATWTDGSVPTATDNVTIGSGCTVTVDVTTAVAFNVTIDNGGTLQSPLTGTDVNNNLTVGGNVTNNGTLDFSTNGDTSGAILTFSGIAVPNVTFGGTGAVTDVRAITVAKGTQANTVELNTSNFTVRGVDTDVAGFLTLTSGTFKVSGTFTVANRVFTAAAYTIPASGGFWLDNPNFTVAGQNGSPTNNGLLRVTSGTFNVGTSSGNSMGGGAGAVFTFEGGTSNFAGRLQTASTVTYNQSGGDVNVQTVGNAAATAGFGLTATTNTFNMTGGSITIVNPSSNATPLDYSVSTSAAVVWIANPAGTTLKFGSSGTYRVLGSPPNIEIAVGQSMAIGSGAAGGAIFFRGSTIVNNGAIINQGTGASGRFDWAASGPMSYSGTGEFGTAVAPILGVGMSANGGDTTVNAPIFINRVNFFTGGFINSNNINLGNGGASTVVIQVGNSGDPTNAGEFDVSPVYDIGSGGQILLHLRTTTLNRSTGFEVNPSRTLTQLTVDNNVAGATLTIAGGDLTVNTTLALTNGMVIVPTGDTLFHDAGTVTRVNGRVNGNLSRNFTAAGAYTYHVGTDNGYSPVVATVTAGSFPQDLAVHAIQGAQPNIPNPSLALSRYWSLDGSDLTADLTFNYLDPTDIPGTADESLFVIFKYDGTLTQPGGTVNPAANSATITGVTSFSDWTLGEPDAASTGDLNIDVDPLSLSSTQPPDEQVTQILSITNSGGVGFEGPFDLANWTLTNDPSGTGGSFNTNPGPPIELFVVGGNSGTGGDTNFWITIPEDGVISFNWGYQSTDSGTWDSGGVAVNGSYTQLANNASQVPYFNGAHSLPVVAGDTFAFRVNTVDGDFGAGILGVTNFLFQSATGGGDLVWQIVETDQATCASPNDVPWLSVTPDNGTTASGDTDAVDVTFDSIGLAPGTYTADLCISSNDPDPGPGNGTDLVIVPVELTVVVPPPNIVVDPLSLDSTQPPGSQVTQSLIISNTGGSDLNWDIFEGDATVAPLSPYVTDRYTPSSDQPVVTAVEQCAQYANYPGAEPEGYAQYCAHDVIVAPWVSSSFDPTDIAYAQDIGFVSDNFVSHILNNFSGQTVIGPNPRPIFAMDFDETATTLYALDNTTRELGTYNLTTGAFTLIAVVSGIPAGENMSGLTIDPATGTAYVSGISGGGMTLYTFNLATAVATPIGADPARTLMIDIAIGPQGVMYGHDIGTDSIYTIDISTGLATLVGPTGIDSNFAQGMDFDNADGTLYAYTYQSGGANQYGTINLATGAFTPLAINTPLGEFEGATQTIMAASGPCSVPSDIPWLSVNPDNGVTAAGDSDEVVVTFDTTGLTAGSTYTGTLCINSNDPANPLVEVAVTLVVEEPEPTYGVQLSPATAAASGVPGGTVEYTLTITNTGNGSDTFSLTAGGNDWSVDLPDDVTLDAGGSTTFAVTVTIPGDAEDGDVDTVTITATSTGDPGESASSELTTTAVVAPVYGVQVTAEDAALSGAPGGSVAYTIWITNTGDVQDSFDLEVAGIWNATPSAISVTLDVDGSTSVVVTVDIPGGANDGDTDVTTFTATSQSDASATDSVDLTTTAVGTPEYGVEVAAEDADLSGAPGSTVMYTVWITNTGNVQDTFNLTAVGIWNASPSVASVTLAAGASTSVMVHVDIPGTANNDDTDVTTFTATSQTDASATDSVSLTTTAVVADTTVYIYLPIILKP